MNPLAQSILVELCVVTPRSLTLPELCAAIGTVRPEVVAVALEHLWWKGMVYLDGQGESRRCWLTLQGEERIKALVLSSILAASGDSEVPR